MALYTDITIDQGTTYTGRIPVTGANGLPVDLTDFSARGLIKKSYSSTTSINFSTTIDDPLSGIVFISLTPQQTKALKPGRYVFDVEIYNSDESNVIRISEGQVTVTPSATSGATA